jgi:hypothetical protein
MKKHYVIYLSPGTFVAEQTQKEIESWDVEKAMGMARGIKERYGAIPYGFQFVTRERGEKDFDSKETKRSGTYYLGGKVWTIDDLKKRNDPKDKILISNMESNNYPRVVENNNSWKWIQPLRKGDVVLDFHV